MSRQQVLQLVIAVILVTSFLIGCGGSAPTAVSEAPTAAPTPEPPEATPTPEPPTSTPTLPKETPAPEVFQPQPGAILTGAIEDGEDVGKAMVSLELSEDGSAITTVTITLMGPGECGEVTLPTSESAFDTFINGPFPISEGSINVPLPEEGELKGQFTSPTEANGTINVLGLTNVPSCEFGPSPWSATIVTSTVEQPTPTPLPAEPASSTGPKAGHWEGEPSVSFDVTSAGAIRSFKAIVPYAGGECVFDLGDTDIEKDGTFVFTNLIAPDKLNSNDKGVDMIKLIETVYGKLETIETDSGEMIVMQRINGKFDDADTATGIAKIWMCSTEGGGFSISESKGIEWNAEWKEP